MAYKDGAVRTERASFGALWGFATHVGFYHIPSGIAAFKDELKLYKSAKGSVQFPLSRPMPADLIRRMVEFRIAETTGKTTG